MPHSATPAHVRKRWSIPLGAFALAAVLLIVQAIYWQGHIRHAYSPVGDEFSLLTHSARMFHPHPSEWFTRGYADYFQPFPDLATPYSEFLRPADNAVYYLNSLLFGHHWSAYLFANYLFAAVLCAMVFSFAASALRLPLLVTLLLTCASIASPAYNYDVLYRPSFAFDYLGAMFTLCCAFCLARNRLTPAWLFALLAVLSKETAYYTPVAACAAVALFDLGRRPRPRWLRAGLFLVPLAAVLILRQLDFRRASGVYVVAGLTPKALIRNIILGITNWPYRLPGEQHIFELSAYNLGSLLLTALLWVLLVTLLLILLQQRRGAREISVSPTPISLGVVLLFLLGSCCFPIALGLGPRFGASTFPLLFLTLGALTAGSWPYIWIRPAALLILILITLANAWQLTATFSAKTLQAEASGWAMSRNLVDQLSHDRHSVRFLLVDVTESFAAPSSFQQFLGSSQEVFPVADFAGSACASKPTLGVDNNPPRFSLDATLKPGCGAYALYTTARQPGDPGAFVARNLPQAKITYRSPAPSLERAAYSWNVVHIELSPRIPSFVVYFPDFASETYRTLGSSETTTGKLPGQEITAVHLPSDTHKAAIP